MSQEVDNDISVISSEGETEVPSNKKKTKFQGISPSKFYLKIPGRKHMRLQVKSNTFINYCFSYVKYMKCNHGGTQNVKNHCKTDGHR